ncbi:MAG: ABC transporter substrate-binding protein [Chloroflexota bacterium]
MAPPLTPPGGPRRLAVPVAVASIAVVLAGVALFAGPGGSGARSAGSEVKVLGGEPASLDPARHGDAGSAAMVSQLFETLTALDPSLTLRPALAESWVVEPGAKRVVFTLRAGLTFSDGSPLRANDVVRSWRRLVDPDHPSPLASLLADVRGADAALAGTGTAESVGISADGDRRVVVDLARPAADFPTIVASPAFGIVPASIGDGDVGDDPRTFVGSGAYVLHEHNPEGLQLSANPAYWAGRPSVATIDVTTDLGGSSAVQGFENRTVDYAAVPGFDARWIAYDDTLGPDLRQVPSLSVEYYGFDTRRPPFDNARVRRAFAEAVDWRRIAALDETGTSTPATGLVPDGIPGRPAGDFLPRFDPGDARRLLADAGYADVTRLPRIDFVSSGSPHDEAVVDQLKANLGVDVAYETMDFEAYSDRLASDPPSIWTLSWVADYPGPNDFLGVLLRTGSTANYGGYRSAAFDAAIDRARAASDEAATEAGYAAAMQIVRDDVPVVPVTYGTGWALARSGLLGAQENGNGILRFAGLEWAAP